MPDTATPDIPSSPSARLLGWTLLEHDAPRGWVRIGFEARPEFCNPAGYVQGGFLAAMMDDCMGPAAWFKSGGELYSPTIDMNISFLAPAPPGPLIGEGQVVQLGRSIGFIEARLMRSDGELVARATASARLVAARRALDPARGHGRVG